MPLKGLPCPLTVPEIVPPVASVRSIPMVNWPLVTDTSAASCSSDLPGYHWSR